MHCFLNYHKIAACRQHSCCYAYVYVPEERESKINENSSISRQLDPATYGHLDVIRRAAVSFDKVIVGVLHNSSKSPLFSVEERVKILTKATKDIPNVEVKAFEGLSVNFARENHAQVIVRGLRAVTGF